MGRSIMNKITNKTAKIILSWLDSLAMKRYIWVAVGDEDMGKGTRFLKLDTTSLEYETWVDDEK